ncbi:MAG: histone acetyltransferase HPA2 [Pseudomonas sp.]|nr:histone acetyltransferase HPA2 [Pseudomonas sp.]
MNDEDGPALNHNSSEEAVTQHNAEDLPAIEFESPGRFSLHNSQCSTADTTTLEPAPFSLGQDSQVQHFNSQQGARAHALALLQQAQRSLCLYSVDLEPWLYHHSSMQAACTEFLLANPRNQLRILLRDTNLAVKHGHRLLTLARRLSSNCLIRKLHPDYPSEALNFLLVDDCALLLRPEPGQYAGYACYQDPANVRLRRAQFEQAWNTSISDADLRSFLL